MLSKKLPSAGAGFKLSGASGFNKKLSYLTKTGQFSSLKNNRQDILKIFKSLSPILRKKGALSLMKRREAYRSFSALPDLSKQDKLNFKKILDNYK